MGGSDGAARIHRAPTRVADEQFGDPSQISKWLGVAGQDAADALAVAPTDPDALELRATARYFTWMYNLNPDPGGADEAPGRRRRRISARR